MIPSMKKMRVTITTMNGCTIERYVITSFQATAVKRILDTMTEGGVNP